MENEEMTNVPNEENNALGDLSGNGNAIDGDDNSPVDEGSEKDSWFEDPNAKASESPRVKKMLDELTDDGTEEEVPPYEDGGAGNENRPSGLVPDAGESRPKTAEEEEMELLQHVKSERGRERIKSIISARKEAEMLRTETQSEMDHFKKLIDMTGLDRSDLAQTFEFGRLMNRGDDKSLQMALNMLEKQREIICKKLGREAPGVDLLSDFPDLKSAVERQELSMDHALKLAKYERAERMNRQYQSADAERIERSQEVLGNLQGIASSCDNFFKMYEGKADHEAKMKCLGSYFADPDNLNEFLKTIPPSMWFNHMKFLYENMVVVPPRKNDHTQQPLRSRSIATGSVADNPNMSNLDRILKRMDDMGI